MKKRDDSFARQPSEPPPAYAQASGSWLPFSVEALALLRGRKILFILDDSQSMVNSYGPNPEGPEPRTLWKDAEDALIGMLERLESTSYRSDITIVAHLLNARGKDEYSINGKNDVKTVFKNACDGSTPMGTTVSYLLNREMLEWQDQRERMKTSVIVITDGDPYPEKEKTILEDTLKSTAKKLDSLGYPEDQLVISFLQIGDNEEAMQYLQKLDDLAHPSRKHKITHFWHKGYRDIVDCVPYKDNVQFTGDMVVKALVGSLDPKVDKFKT